MGDSTMIRAAETVLPCQDVQATAAFFIERLGFRMEQIFPADDPSVAVLSGHGHRMRLERGADLSPGMLRLLVDDPMAFSGGAERLTAPNGTVVQLSEATPGMDVPPIRPALVVSRQADGSWVDGRAGMGYRDLIPDRLGGYMIASHIRIPDGGPVPDHVHFHQIHFQMIYCYRGWVRVVYEDNGPPFVLNAGDCVMQPPGIRHQVLEASPGLEVIELGSPAEHITGIDHDIALPQDALDLDRLYGGQRFLRHVADGAPWTPWRFPGHEARDIGISAASFGIAGAQVVRPRSHEIPPSVHDAEFLFVFLLEGGARLSAGDEPARVLTAGDSFVVPAGLAYGLSDIADGTEFLEVSLPGSFLTRPG